MSIAIVFVIATSCKENKKAETGKVVVKKEIFKKGTFGYDRVFLQKYYKNTIVLESEDKNASLVLSPELQGRVMTSTLGGNMGRSFGWLNYDLIQSGEIKEHFNPTGGEERFWIGPEGGQFSVFFQREASFEFKNWYVPSSIDTDAFETVAKNKSQVTFTKEFDLTNNSGTKFELAVDRKVSLLSKKQINTFLEFDLKDISTVAYETQNTIKNIGTNEWKEASGLLSIWMLCMMTPSPEVTVVVPIKEGSVSEIGTKVNDNYFGKVSADRLKKTERNVFFKADGNSRGKIGVSPSRATSFIGSYDGQNKVLTLLEISEPKSSDKYVNSAWENQKNPYKGDVINSYNDGKLEDGTQMGPFYELESSSPALALKPQEKYTHIQRIYHFKGSASQLNTITLKTLNTTIEEIEVVF